MPHFTDGETRVGIGIQEGLSNSNPQVLLSMPAAAGRRGGLQGNSRMFCGFGRLGAGVAVYAASWGCVHGSVLDMEGEGE